MGRLRISLRFLVSSATLRDGCKERKGQRHEWIATAEDDLVA
jgi:hypothetical protein